MQLRSPIALAILLLVGIFVLDVSLPLGFAVWSAYLIPIILFSRMGAREAVVVSTGATILLAAGYHLSPETPFNRMALVNRSIITAVLWIVSSILIRMKRAELERERLAQEVQKALDEVKTLRGMLPICSSCKRIRDDKGYWEQIEIYLADRSEAQFTHALCPECADRLYPEIMRKLKEGKHEM